MLAVYSMWDQSVHVAPSSTTMRFVEAISVTRFYGVSRWVHSHWPSMCRYQLADWRIRPLPDELMLYARMDTHYLLYIWRKMKEELLEANAGQPRLLLSVFEQSRQICGAVSLLTVFHCAGASFLARWKIHKNRGTV